MIAGKTDKKELLWRFRRLKEDSSYHLRGFLIDSRLHRDSHEATEALLQDATFPPQRNICEFFKSLLQMYLLKDAKDFGGERGSSEGSVEGGEVASGSWKLHDVSDTPPSRDISYESSFSQLGGTSILAVSIATQLRQVFPRVGGQLLDKLLNGRNLHVSIKYLQNFMGGGKEEGSGSGEKDFENKNENIENDSNLKKRRVKLDNEEGLKKRRVEERLSAARVTIVSRFERVEAQLMCWDGGGSEGRCFDVSTWKRFSYHLHADARSESESPVAEIRNSAIGRERSSNEIDEMTTMEEAMRMGVKWAYDTHKCVDASPVIVASRCGIEIY